MGTSRHLSVGPTSATAALLASSVTAAVIATAGDATHCGTYAARAAAYVLVAEGEIEEWLDQHRRGIAQGGGGQGKMRGVHHEDLVFVFGTDVTERRRAEQEALREVARFPDMSLRRPGPWSVRSPAGRLAVMVAHHAWRALLDQRHRARALPRPRAYAVDRGVGGARC